MSLSRYSYKRSGTIIEIIDLIGRKSVTNNIENVIEEISKKEEIDPKTLLVYYKDTYGEWGAWDTREEKFIPWTKGSIIS